jgi:cell division protein FtsL
LSNARRKRFRDSSWFFFGVLALLGVAASGIQVIGVTDDRRGLFHELTSNQEIQDSLLQEYSRLLLERGTLLSYQNVDRIAQRRLNMRFPEQVTSVVRQPKAQSLAQDRNIR